MVSNVDIIIYILNDFSDYTEYLLWNHNVSMDPIEIALRTDPQISTRASMETKRSLYLSVSLESNDQMAKVK